MSEQFESFVAGLRPVFNRADQFLCCRAYLRGVLEASERRNVETIAASAAAAMTVAANLPQALQHFVSNSPWDHRSFVDRLRDQTRQHRQDAAAVWVIHDAVFVKKGRHSVAAHRQYARSLGRKVNCQIGVILAQSGPAGYFPLAARLYVPGAWLREHADAAARQIPEANRQIQSRAQIAIALLEEVREAGEPVRRVSAEPSYTASEDFQGDLTKKGFELAAPAGEELAASLQQFTRLKTDFGLDHFEGRNWQGWHHHVVLVFAAYYFAAIHRAGTLTTG